jgi:hypothetical protein
MAEVDHELEVLLSLDGFEFQFAGGYRVKIEAQQVAATKSRPHGLKYSLTLHDEHTGRRIYGLDNAHAVSRRRHEFDHRHVYGRRRIVPYAYTRPAELLADFYREVERILKERGAL